LIPEKEFFMNRNTLLARRVEHFDAADALTTAAIRRGSELTETEKQQLDWRMGEIKNIDAQIAEADAQIAAGPTNGNRRPSVPVVIPSVTANDPTIGRIFAKGESIAEHVQRQGRVDHPGVTLGDLCKAMALGGGTPEIRAALAEGSDSAGGVTVPTFLSSQLIDALRARSTVFAAGAKTMVLETGKTSTIATITGDPSATWRAENAAVNTSDMTFGSVVFNPKTLAVILVASRELIEDSLNFQQAITTSLSKSFAAELDRVALIGSGSGSEPKGCSKFSGVGSVSVATDGAVLSNYDPFVQALGTMRTANAADPTACIMHPRTDQEINLLKDSQQRPLARPQAIANLPFLVTSKLPTNEVQGASGVVCSRAIMGDFTELIVGVRHLVGIELLREKYADNYQYGFLCSLRADIAVAHAASFCNIVGIK
jgi:HK97 family phage major capsid protein